MGFVYSPHIPYRGSLCFEKGYVAFCLSHRGSAFSLILLSLASLIKVRVEFFVVFIRFSEPLISAICSAKSSKLTLPNKNSSSSPFDSRRISGGIVFPFFFCLRALWPFGLRSGATFSASLCMVSGGSSRVRTCGLPVKSRTLYLTKL